MPVLIDMAAEDVGALGFFLYRCGPHDRWHKHDLGLCATLVEAKERASEWERSRNWDEPVTDRRIGVVHFTAMEDFEG